MTAAMKAFGVLFLFIASVLPARAGGDSSDGHTHAAPAAVAVVPTGPRLATASAEFELVGVLEGKTLTLYLDRYASNAPVLKARVEVESSALNGVAGEVSPGVYALPADALGAGGKHALTFSVETEDSADLLNATLDLGAASATVVDGHTHISQRWLVGSAAALLLAGGFVLIRRRRNAGKNVGKKREASA
jgi:hypothetical protein